MAGPITDLKSYIEARNARPGITSRLTWGTIGRDAPEPALAAAVKGMSGGKIAAIVAGVGLAAAGAVTLFQPKEPEPAGPRWADRIDQERALARARPSDGPPRP